MNIDTMVPKLKADAIKLAATGSEIKNQALRVIQKAMLEKKEDIIKANLVDLERSREENLPMPMQKRLVFDEKKIQDVIEGIEALIQLEDPIGKTLLSTELDRGLELYRVSCPIGVIGIIFESRPDALVQISTLCLKSGNCVLLKGGSEAKETNRILTDIIREATVSAGIPQNWIYLLDGRSEVAEMLKRDDCIDLIIPRGSNEFVRYIMDHSKIPVMGHSDGICHCYIEEDAQIPMAVKIVVDSKIQYVAACNALETVLVHKKIAEKILPELQMALEAEKVSICGCEKTRNIISVEAASEEDWATEYLDYKVSIKIVDNFMEAVDHINQFGSGHTDTIITDSKEKALKFMDYVDSGSTFWNCSTRFSDGFRYGFGAEVGISTGKLHARGPVGLEGLVSYKYKLLGSGQMVGEYARGEKTFTHKPMKKVFEEE